MTTPAQVAQSSANGSVARARLAEAHARRYAEFVEDLEFLLNQDQDPDRVAAALGTTRQTIQRRLHRHGETGLLTRMYSTRTRQY